MEGFGVHSFRFLDAAGGSRFVKFHWKPKLGLQSVAWSEAVKINGADPDFHRRDLWDAITNGDFPEWELGVQVFDDEFADRFAFDILDPTKIIPEEDVPVRRIGRLVLDRVVDNFFAETEQVAFCTQNVVDGIDFTNDPLLQGRNFSYLDTQLKRLGSPNFTDLPINAPKCPFATFQQDGHMAQTNPVGRANYEPNSWPAGAGGPREDAERGFATFAERIEGDARRLRPESFADHFSQARQFYLSQTPVERKHITDSFVFELSKVERVDIRERMVGNLRNVDEDLARQVSDLLGLEQLPAKTEPAVEPRTDLAESPALSIVLNGPETFAGRKLGVLVSDGADASVVEQLLAEVEEEEAQVEFVAPKVGGFLTSDGAKMVADQKLGGGPSVLYDAVAVVVSEEGARRLADQPAARDFVADAFAHCKFIGYVAAATPLLEAAGVAARIDDGFVPLDTDGAAQLLERCRDLRFWERELLVPVMQ
jgi:catalase